MKQNPTRPLWLFLVFCLTAVICIYFSRGKITVASVLTWLPKRSPMAILFLMGLYLAKSLSFFFPLAVLQTACGAAFPFFSALLVNLCGTAAAMSLPWLLCRCGKVDFSKLQQRFPILQKAQQFHSSSNFLHVLFLRAAGCFPFDAVSFYLGTLKISFGTYLAAGLLGCFPQLFLATALGAGLSHPALRLLPAIGGGAALCIAVLTIRRIQKAHAK